MDILVYIENEQDRLPFDEKHEELIKAVIRAALEHENFNHDCFVSVTVTDNDNIRDINREQRNIDRATDVLSFPVLEFEDGKMVENVGDTYEDKLILGDIVLSLERAMEQCREYGHSFEREVGYLVCHSVLHLLGYDHENEDERAVMREKEESVMDSLKLTREGDNDER